jgi:hypothetical protein
MFMLIAIHAAALAFKGAVNRTTSRLAIRR